MYNAGMVPRKIPALRSHAGKGLAYVCIKRKQYLLGPIGSEEAQENYRRLIDLWLSGGRRLPADFNLADFLAPTVGEVAPPTASANVESARVTLREVLAGYLDHVERSYSSREPANIASRMRLFSRYWSRNVGEEAPVTSLRHAVLCDYLMHLAAKGLSWGYSTKCRRDILAMVSWAVTRGLAPPSLRADLREVPNLKRSTPGLRSDCRVKAVSREVIDATLPHLPPSVAAMVELGYLTGARSCEIRAFRAEQVRRVSDCDWRIVLETHKNSWRANAEPRVVFLKGRALEIVRERCARVLEGPLFSPQDEQARGNSGNRRPYSQNHFARIIAQVCKKHGILHWSPGQLRHSAATWMVRDYQPEVARILLGHSSVRTTERYRESDHDAAARAFHEAV